MNYTHYAFTNSVKTVQEQYGSRDAYARMEQSSDRIKLTAMDYAQRERLKIWAETEMVEIDTNSVLHNSLRIPGYKAVVERAVLLHVKAFDWNCPQHITPRFTLEEIADGIHLNAR